MISRLENPKGFTLIEVIVTIIVSAILAVMLIQVMGWHTGRSYRPLMKMNEGLAVKNVMERISADYRNLIITHETPIEELHRRIRDEGAGRYWNGEAYSAGISVDDNYCLDLNRDDDATPGEVDTGTCEHRLDENFILKVTISLDGQSLTTLFTR